MKLTEMNIDSRVLKALDEMGFTDLRDTVKMHTCAYERQGSDWSVNDWIG